MVTMMACGRAPTAPTAQSDGSAASDSGQPAPLVSGSGPATPETPPFNLEAVLRPPSGGAGFGLVKFRQPNDGMRRVYLDTWVRDLAPNTEYSLQRAVDATLDGACTSGDWLTLGKGLTSQALLTDDMGTGREEFYRDLPAGLVAQTFDIHFRIVTQSGTEVLSSGCYQYVVEPD
jgi:hypothetical protein